MHVVQDGDRPLDVLEGNGDVRPTESRTLSAVTSSSESASDPVEGGPEIGEHLPGRQPPG
jgi:hypothetical protein